MNTVLLTCIGTDSDVTNPNLLRHFLDHYLSLGITNWAITLHTGPDPELHNVEYYKQVLTEEGIAYDLWDGEFNTFVREGRHNEFVRAQTDDTWIIGVDLDEFVASPEAIPRYLERVDRQGYNCVAGGLVDRVSDTGELKHIEPYPSLSEQFPIIGEVKRNIYQPAFPVAPYEKKIAIRRPLQWGLGHHFITRETRQQVREDPNRLAIDHYAWDDLLIPRIKQRLGDSWAQEYRNMISYISEHGRLRMGDIQFTESD